MIGIRAGGLGRRFVSASGEVSALIDVDLNLRIGRYVAISGPSGCGKSTLLNLLGLLDRPSVGSLELFGVRTEALRGDQIAALRREVIGFLFQDAGLVQRMTVLDNVMMPLEYRGLRGRDRTYRAAAALEKLGIADRSTALVDTLSGGERQRVGLARILATRPRLIICDEPTASLDETNSRLVIDQLLTCADEGSLVICASHDPIAIDRAHIHIALSRGRILSLEEQK